MKSIQPPIALSANEKRLINSFRTADRRGRQSIIEHAENVEEKYPRVGKAPRLLPLPGGAR